MQWRGGRRSAPKTPSAGTRNDDQRVPRAHAPPPPTPPPRGARCDAPSLRRPPRRAAAECRATVASAAADRAGARSARELRRDERRAETIDGGRPSSHRNHLPHSALLVRRACYSEDLGTGAYATCGARSRRLGGCSRSFRGSRQGRRRDGRRSDAAADATDQLRRRRSSIRW